MVVKLSRKNMLSFLLLLIVTTFSCQGMSKIKDAIYGSTPAESKAQLAARDGSLKELQATVKTKEFADQHGLVALAAESEKESLQKITWLVDTIKADANGIINGKKPSRTPLANACAMKNYEVEVFLVEHGGMVNWPRPENINSPLSALLGVTQKIKLTTVEDDYEIMLEDDFELIDNTTDIKGAKEVKLENKHLKNVQFLVEHRAIISPVHIQAAAQCPLIQSYLLKVQQERYANAQNDRIHRSIVDEIDFYEVLKVDKNADQATIKKAYEERTQIVKKNLGTDPKKKIIIQRRLDDAYSVLSDKKYRADYDKDWKEFNGKK